MTFVHCNYSCVHLVSGFLFTCGRVYVVRSSALVPVMLSCGCSLLNWFSGSVMCAVALYNSLIRTTSTSHRSICAPSVHFILNVFSLNRWSPAGLVVRSCMCLMWALLSTPSSVCAVWKWWPCTVYTTLCAESCVTTSDHCLRLKTLTWSLSPLCVYDFVPFCVFLQSAVGHDYQSKLSKHCSQTDTSKGFGGKFGVQADRVDQVYPLSVQDTSSMSTVYEVYLEDHIL